MHPLWLSIGDIFLIVKGYNIPDYCRIKSAKVKNNKQNKEIYAKQKTQFEYNRTVRGVYSEFNGMRDVVADIELKGSVSHDKGKDKDKVFSKEDILENAILKSGGITR